RCAELDERLRVLETPLRLLERRDGFVQELLARRAALDETERAERDADRLRRAPAPCAVESLYGDRDRLLLVAGGVQREREIRAPVVEGAVADAERCAVLAERPELPDGVVVPVLLEPKAPACELEEGQVPVRRDPVREVALDDARLRAGEIAALHRELR